MANTRARVIVNPAAGANSTYRKWPRIRSLLEHVGLSFDHEFTEAVGHAIELAGAAVKNGYNQVVAVGGDGTVNEVANGILNTADANETALGVISTGTGSDFARSAGIPGNYVSACSSITSPFRALIDVGVVEYGKDGGTSQRYFVNTAGVGFDAAVSENTNRLPKNLGGTIPYLLGLATTLIGYRNKLVTLKVEEKEERGRVLSVVVSNGQYFGGGMKVAPDASLDDGLLDVVVIGDIGKFDLLKSLPMIYKGTHGQHPKVSMEQAVEVRVESPERVLVHADGEVLGEGPATFWLKPGVLNVVV